MSSTQLRLARLCLILMRTRKDLHTYQNRAVSFIKDKPRCALFLDMGLGKTISTLTALQDLKGNDLLHGKTLVIAPLRVANTVWETEASKWTHINLTFSLCTGAASKREKALEDQADVYIINRENIPWLVKRYGTRWPFNNVIIDESSSFKSPRSQRFKSLKKILHKTERMVLLTGTPSPNGMLDLWSQIFLLDSGASLGRTMTRYKDRFFISDYHGFNFTLKGGAEFHIQKLISPLVLSMQASDYLKMPERIDNIIPVLLSKKAQRQYKELQTEFILEISKAEVVTAVNAAVLAGKLLQLANGAIYLDESFQLIHDAKLDALAEIIEATDQPILVAYNFKSDLERLLDRFPTGQQLDKYGEVITRWNEGKVPLLFCHPQSAGHGLNLQNGGSTIVWFGLCWSLEYYQQFNARLHRQGQRETVIIHHLVATGTIDEIVMEALTSKNISQNQLLVGLKDLISNKY